MEHGAIIKHDIKKSPRTGSWRYMKPEVDKDKCIGCATCVPFCPDASITMSSEPAYTKASAGKQKSVNSKNKKGIAEIDYEFCKGCGVCAQVCPARAIKMVSGR
ncbi:MAG: 4Fe-4S binding protein [Candidatus Moranbacteria bacterium]|nr:4Fe-4S binding protein [Candidatus Moranbacteria bacterium]